MPEGWEWDATLFSGSAAYYQRGRLPYAPGLSELLAETLALDGRGRLLDVGCGPGILALSLSHLFGEVVGVDPDKDMINEAERQAVQAGLAGKTRWIRARAEQLPPHLGTFTAATFGRSFHWMDRERVAAIIHEKLRPGGAFVHVSGLHQEIVPDDDLPDPLPPYAAIRDLVRRHLGPLRRAGQGVLAHGTPDNEAAVLARAGFAGPERHVLSGGPALERSCDDILAWVFSRSNSAPHLFGDRRSAFEGDLIRLLRTASPSARFSEHQPPTEVFVWRRVAEPAA